MAEMKTVNCENALDKLINECITEVSDTALAVHLQTCKSCNEFAEKLQEQQQWLKDELDIFTDSPEILTACKTELQQQSKTKFAIKNLAKYRIPIYQAAAAVFLCAIIFGSNSAGEQTNMLQQNTEIRSILPVDSLVIQDSLRAGESLYEDSLLSKYTRQLL